MIAMRAAVCIPTYNELENLERMVTALADVLDTEQDRVSSSTTARRTARARSPTASPRSLPWVHVLHRDRKEGIGRAYLAAFRLLPEQPEYVLEMDCDFSHDPRDVPRLMAACDDGADLGARVPLHAGGGGPRNWSLIRRAISRGGCLYAQALLGVGIRDLTGGFKCFRRTVLESIDLDAVTTNGYAFQIELTYRALREGFRVGEIPITFVDREVGGSKMSRSIVIEAAWKVPALKLRALTGRL